METGRLGEELRQSRQVFHWPGNINNVSSPSYTCGCSIKALLLLFLNCTAWLGGSLVFLQLEGAGEAEHKCGVQRVQRNFLDSMWTDSQVNQSTNTAYNPCADS